LLLDGSCWANVVTRIGTPETPNGDPSASRSDSSAERRLSIEGEKTYACLDRMVTSRRRTWTSMRRRSLCSSPGRCSTPRM
jgi:hypothetical protein